MTIRSHRTAGAPESRLETGRDALVTMIRTEYQPRAI